VRKVWGFTEGYLYGVEAELSLKFKPEDFGGNTSFINPQFAADLAQDIFDKWLSEQRLCYTDDKLSDGKFGWWHGIKSQSIYQARLVDIQEIKPKVCEHEPTRYYMKEGNVEVSVYSADCRICGAKLQATWRAVK